MTALMIVPIDVDSSVLTASNIAEDEYDAWDAGTAYAADDFVVRVATHSIYQRVVSGTTSTPPEDDPTNWIRYGSTNRYQAFDGSIGQSATNSETITYTLVPVSRVDAIAFIGLSAITLGIVVKDSGDTEIYSEERDLIDTSGIASWLDYFTYETVYEPEQVFTEIPFVPGGSIEVTIDAGGGTAGVGEIIAGRTVVLGSILDGSRSGFTDFTIRSADAFGNIDFVVRPAARKAEWVMITPTRSNRRIQQELERARGTKCFFYPGEDMADFYLSVFGVADDYFPALSAAGMTTSTLSLTGVS